MRSWRAAIGLAATLAVMMVLGSQGALAACTVTSAPWESLSIHQDAVGRVFYVEERQHCVNFQPDGGRGPGCGYDAVPPTAPPPYQWGFHSGGGTWHYEEANGVPGLQAGWQGPCLPNCCLIWVPVINYCVNFDDPVTDESCGAGPDRLYL